MFGIRLLKLKCADQTVKS